VELVFFLQTPLLLDIEKENCICLIRWRRSYNFSIIQSSLLLGQIWAYIILGITKELGNFRKLQIILVITHKSEICQSSQYTISKGISGHYQKNVFFGSRLELCCKLNQFLNSTVKD
jgi:hypothetical protein